MAPISRASQGGAGVGKKVHRKRSTRREPSDSWSIFHNQGMASNTDGVQTNGHTQIQIPTPPIDGPANVDEAVGPLREMAEKVGTQVEEFAEKLDMFLNDLPMTSDRFDATHDIVLKFQKIAESTVEDLRRSYERELRELKKQEWSENARISTDSDASKQSTSATYASSKPHRPEQVKELRQWQQEADLWDLFRVMLELHPFEADAAAMQDERREKLTRLGQSHRYISDSDLWERFILQDHLARERYSIKQWLERTADHQQSDLQDVMEVLEDKAGMGKGLWSSGWLRTREKIKGEKRLRTWPSSADSPLPQIRRSDDNELMVTNLDPDAPDRQQRTLQQKDTYFERAMWIACWEMLRRGTDPREVSEWCEQRKEGWRALCLGTTEPTASNAKTRRMYLVASQRSNSTQYETAVFGLLGGNARAVEKICRTVDDHLYAFYSTALVRQFDKYLVKACPHEATPRDWQRNTATDSLHDSEQAEQAIKELINKLRQGPATKQESAQPMKIIQSYLLADEVGSLIHTVGAAIAETAALQGPENMIFLRDREASQDGVTLPEAEVALNPQTLRMTAHMAIVHRMLRPDQLEGDELHEDENVLVAYIQALRAAGKRDIIPIYAAQLQRERCIITMGGVLQDISDSQEQSRMLALLQEYDLDAVSLLVEQQRLVIDQSLPSEALGKPLRILESTEETKLHPGQRIIVGFLPDEFSDDDDAVVRALSWFKLMRGGWKVMFEALSAAMRRCLITGRFTCARMIVQNFPYEDVSLRKSYEMIGRSVNLMDDNASAPFDEQEALAWELMKRQSRTYFELEQLVGAVESLSSWRTEEHKYVSKSQKPSNVPSVLKRAKEDVSAAMDPLLKGILQTASNEEEAVDLQFIRKTYLPEILIAYNTVLHGAGNLITRDCLLESMELANTIAKPSTAGDSQESNGLEESFVLAGRMRELVKSFALTSKVMLILKAEGKQWKPRKDREGRDLGIWEIGSGHARDD